MNRLVRFLVCVAALSVVRTAGAEVPPLREEQLKAADLILTGVVKTIETKDMETRGVTRRHYTLTVGVKDIEKGKVSGEGKPITVKGWQTIKTPAGWVGPGGHYANGGGGRISVLKVGTEIRLYLNGKDGTYDILAPNGFEMLNKEPKK